MKSFCRRGGVCIIRVDRRVFAVSRMDHIVIVYIIDEANNKYYQGTSSWEILSDLFLYARVTPLFDISVREIHERNDLRYAIRAINGMYQWVFSE